MDRLPPSPEIRRKSVSLRQFVQTNSIESILHRCGYEIISKIVITAKDDEGKKIIDLIQVRNLDQHVLFIYMDTEDFYFGKERAGDLMASVETVATSSTLNSYWKSLSPQGLGVCHVSRDGITLIARDKNSNRTNLFYEVPTGITQGYYPVVHFSGVESNTNMIRERITEAVNIIHKEPFVVTTESIAHIDRSLVDMCKSLRGSIIYVMNVKNLVLQDVATLERIIVQYEVMRATQTLSETNAALYVRASEALASHRAKIGAIDTIVAGVMECQINIDKLNEIGNELRDAASAIRQL